MENEYLLQVALELKDKMSKQLEEVNRELDGFKKELRSAGVGTDELGSKVNKNTITMKGALNSLAKGAKITAVALTAVGAATVKSFADTEYSVKKVQTISSRSFDTIKNAAYELASKYGGNVTDILQANYDLVSSMGDIAESQYVMDTASQLSLAGFTTLGGGMNALTSVMNAYKMETKDATMVADTLMTVQNNGITTIGELEGSLSNVLPTAASLKVSFLDISAALATMTSNKIPAAQATTQIRQALAELAKTGTSADVIFRQISGGSFQEFINNGGTLIDAFELISKSAEVSGISLYDVFGSVEAAGAVINLTGENLDKFKKNQDAMATSSGTLSRGTETMSRTFKVEYDKIKAVFKEVSDTIGQELIPYMQDIKKALLEIDFKKLLAKENVDSAISFAKGLGTISVSIWGISSAIKGVEAAAKGATALMAVIGFLKSGGLAAVAAVAANPIVGAGLIATGAGATLGAQLAGIHNQDDLLLQSNYKKWDKSNPMVDSGVDNSWLKQQEQKEYFQKPKNLEDMIVQTKELKEEIKDIPIEGVVIVNDKAVGTVNGAKESVGTIKKEISETAALWEKFNSINPKAEAKSFAFDLSELEKAEEKLRGLESVLDEALDIGLSNDSLSPIIAQYEEAKRSVENLKTELNAKEFKESFEKEFEEMNLKFEIFGVEEEEKLLQTIRVLEGQVSKAISEGMVGKARQIGEELKKTKENYKTTYELPREGQKKLDDGLKTLSNSIYQIADVVKSEFLNTISTLINGITVISSSLQQFSATSANGAASGMGSIFGGMGSFFSNPATSAMFGKISAGLAIGGAVIGMASSIFGGSDEKREKKNAENKKKFEENTNALKQLGERLRANTATLKDFANTIIMSIAANPTLHRIAGGQSSLKTMEDVMMENKDFGQLSFLVKERKKDWKGKSKSYYKNRGMSEQELFKIMGYDKSTNIDDFDLEALKKFKNDLDGVSSKKIRDWADSLTSRKIGDIDYSSFIEYKKNVEEYIKQIEMLQKEQKEMFRNVTLEAFEGISVIDERELTEQYKKMFDEMGLDSSKYKDTIKSMVDDNKVLVNSMEDVRSGFIESLISGEGDIVSSMGSYFQKLIKNAAMTVYDTLYSEFDDSMNGVFLEISEKLVKMKESGKVNLNGFWNDFDFDKIIDAQKIESNFKVVIDDLRKQLTELGIEKEIIDAFLPPEILTEAEKKLEELKNLINNTLTSAMSQGLSQNDFKAFEKTLGQSIYNSVKDGLVKAFVESETYKKYIDKYFDNEAFEKELADINDPEKAFKLMQDYLEKLYGKLESNGMGFDQNVTANKKDETQLGNSYYSEGPSQINITVTQSFSGVYGEDSMYQIAKKGIKDGLEEVKNQSKVLGVI